MNDKEYRIVRITNIAPFDFTGELGARFGGTNFPILAGESKLFPLYLGEHLAMHLARQIIIQKAPIRDEKQTDGKGTDRPLWDEAGIKELTKKIMVEVYQEDKPPIVSEADAIVNRVKDLNKTVAGMEEENVKTPAGNVQFAGAMDENQSSDVVYQDKGEVIAELDKRGIKYDPRSSKAMLESFLVK